MRLNHGRVKPAGVAVVVLWGVVVWTLPGLRGRVCGVSGRFLERVAVVGESPVRENAMPGLGRIFPSSSEPVEFAVNLPGPPGKPKYSLVTDSGQVP
jgi:hypothetical protein